MNRCNKALLDEYPQIHLFGETWVHGIPDQSFFTENFTISLIKQPARRTDFPTEHVWYYSALTQPFGWTEGVNRLYLTPRTILCIKTR